MCKHPIHKEEYNEKNGSCLSKFRESLLLMAVINHILWSCLPIISRYLQVLASTTVNGLVLVSTGKAIAFCCVFVFGDVHFIKESTIETASSKKEIDIEKQVQQNPLSNGKTRMKVLVGLMYAALTAIRSSLTIIATRYTTATNTALINNLSPLTVPLAEGIFLKTKLPGILWPTVIFTTIGCTLVILAQSAWLAHNNDSFENSITAPFQHAFNMNDLIGCSLQFFCIFLTAAVRLMMKTSSSLLSRNELLQYSNMGCIVFPMVYSLYLDPSVWLYFLKFFEFPVLVFASWFTVCFLIYFVASTMQMELIRSMGPSLYTSLSGIRVLSVVVLSAAWLGEPLVTSLEGWGFLITVVSIAVYMRVLITSDKEETNLKQEVILSGMSIDYIQKEQALLFDEEQKSYHTIQI